MMQAKWEKLRLFASGASSPADLGLECGDGISFHLGISMRFPLHITTDM
jgi:hypothetical protein